MHVWLKLSSQDNFNQSMLCYLTSFDKNLQRWATSRNQISPQVVLTRDVVCIKLLAGMSAAQECLQNPKSETVGCLLGSCLWHQSIVGGLFLVAHYGLSPCAS